jgi:hypothetical protein
LENGLLRITVVDDDCLSGVLPGGELAERSGEFDPEWESRENTTTKKPK